MGEAKRRANHNDMMTNPRYVFIGERVDDAAIRAVVMTPFHRNRAFTLTPDERDEITEFARAMAAAAFNDPLMEPGVILVRQGWSPDTPKARRRNCRTRDECHRLATTTDRLVVSWTLTDDVGPEKTEWVPVH